MAQLNEFTALVWLQVKADNMEEVSKLLETVEYKLATYPNIKYAGVLEVTKDGE